MHLVLMHQLPRKTHHLRSNHIPRIPKSGPNKSFLFQKSCGRAATGLNVTLCWTSALGGDQKSLLHLLLPMSRKSLFDMLGVEGSLPGASYIARKTPTFHFPRFRKCWYLVGWWMGSSSCLASCQRCGVFWDVQN